MASTNIVGVSARTSAPLQTRGPIAGRGRRLAASLVSAALVAGACIGAMGGASPPATRAAGMDVQVVGQRHVALAGARILSLSPDGRWLAAYDASGGRLCIYVAASLARGRCAGLPDGPIETRSVAWSPNSARLVLTEDLFLRGHESDIWVFDRASGTLTDVTDDGVSGDVFLGHLRPKGGEAQLDVSPAWSPDGRTIVFARTPYTCGGTPPCADTSLYTVPARGGAARLLLDAERGMAFALFYGLRWTRAGKILYTLASSRAHDPMTGVWVVGADGRGARRLVKEDAKLGPPILAGATPGGDTALIYYFLAAEQYNTIPGVSFYALLDTRTGVARPLKRIDKVEGTFIGPYSAVFSPDGSRVLYVYRTLADLAPRLVVRNLRGGTAYPLAVRGASQGLSGNIGIGQGLDWASDNTVYVAQSPYSGLLLTLGPR